jgi:hypothetical protein
MPYIIKIDINYHKTSQRRVNVCIAKYIKTWSKQNLDTVQAAVIEKKHQILYSCNIYHQARGQPTQSVQSYAQPKTITITARHEPQKH